VSQRNADRTHGSKGTLSPMTSRRVAELDDECLRVTHDPTSDEFSINLVPVFFEWLRDAGHPIENIKTVYNAVSLKDDGNTGYVVCEVETLEYPIDLADASKDVVDVWCCSCPDWHYRRSPNLQDNERPSAAGECKHIQKVKRKEWEAVDDPNQTSLGVSD